MKRLWIQNEDGLVDVLNVRKLVLNYQPEGYDEKTPLGPRYIEVIRVEDHDRIVAERDELWKRATKFVMPGEMDTGESIEHYIKTLEQTIATQAKVIEKLREQRDYEIKQWLSGYGAEERERRVADWIKTRDAELAAIEKGV